MNLSNELIQQIKQTVHKAEPGAEIILFGSYARGDQRTDSDIDLLILIDAEKQYEQVKKITYPLFDLSFALGEAIVPLVMNKKEWETIHRSTALYQNIKDEGYTL